MSNEIHQCRNCKTLISLSSTGYAEVVSTKKKAKWNWYGGWVCSRNCDEKASMDLQSSMPHAGVCKSLTGATAESVKRNWEEDL